MSLSLELAAFYYLLSVACVASVSVRFSARSRHFLFFSRAKIGASAKQCVTGEGKGEKETLFPFHALFCARPNFPAAKKAKSASNVRKALPKRLLRKLSICDRKIKGYESKGKFWHFHVIDMLKNAYVWRNRNVLRANVDCSLLYSQQAASR